MRLTGAGSAEDPTGSGFGCEDPTTDLDWYHGDRSPRELAPAGCGIRDVVDGTRTMPGRPAEESAKKTWLNDNARAMFLISSSIEYWELEPLLMCSTAKEMWDKLSRIHEQKSSANKLLLTQRFYEYRMSPGDTVVQHIAKVQNMAAQLRDDSVDLEQQTMEHLQDRLIREEARLTGESKPCEAFSAFKKNNAVKNEQSGAKLNNKKPQRTGTKRGRVGNAGDTGPLADIVKSVLNADQKDIWITDSGASRHMTPRREWFSDFTKLKNSEPIFLSDNKKCDVIGKGTIQIQKFVNDKDEFFCESCQIGKSHRLVFRKCRKRESTVPGELMHKDVCGLMSVETPGGARFLLTFKDDATSI
ncbi:uncharacterized protein LOC143905782 [Temnothorax americanus]|uniref:uncharacterized protein LOC143905782 n=1 Tax=Temnothorax americanus TaxID=1964332 RepID=UPI0040679527